MCQENGCRDEYHTADDDDTKHVTILKRALIVFTTEVQIVVTQQRHANHTEELQRSKINPPLSNFLFLFHPIIVDTMH